MDLSEIINIAWNGVTSNKLRSILTMLGVIIGVAAVIMVISVSAGTEASIAAQIENLGTNLLFVTQNFTAGGPRTQTNQYAKRIVLSRCRRHRNHTRHHWC